MRAFEQAAAFLPDGLRRALLSVPVLTQERVQEIRLRQNGLLTVSLPEGEFSVDTAGVLSERPDVLTVYCSGEDLEKTFLKLCDYSVHSHSEQLRSGFITAKGGFRVGVAGTAVTENGVVTAVRDIRSLCLRVATRHDGCAAALYPLFAQRIPSVLIVGEPSAGKTSMLRDIARVLSEGARGKRFRVTVVDERGEIAGTGGLHNADILSGIPKPIGILQAVRTLAPDVIILDELGTFEEVEAITQNLHAGVPAIATAHCRNLQEALRRDAVRLALQRRVFDTVVFLRGREAPGEIREVVEVETLEMDRLTGVEHGRDVRRYRRREVAASAGAHPATAHSMVTGF